MPTPAYIYDPQNLFAFMAEQGYFPDEGQAAPPNSTPIAPPSYGQYEIPAFNVETATWSIIPDYRYVPLYTQDGFLAPQITVPGVVPDASLLLSPNLAWYQRQQIDALIAASDAAISGAPGFTSSATGTEYTYGINDAWCEELENAYTLAHISSQPDLTISLPVLDANKWPSIVPHTVPQVLSVASAYWALIAASRAQLAARIASVRAITDDSPTGYAAVQAMWAQSV